jgi:hypothetical protein
MHGNKAKTIYCHSDGYLSYVGQVLLDNYDSSKANFLVAQGDCSMLGKEIGEKIDFNERMEYDTDNKAKQCRFYKRDRDETGVDFMVSFSDKEMFEKYEWCEYFYIMFDGCWFVSQGEGTEWKVLRDAIREENEPGFKAPSITRMVGLLEAV